MNGNKEDLERILRVAKAIVEASLEECRLFWGGTGEQYHSYRKIQKALAAQSLERISDDAFKEFVLGFNPLFHPTPDSERSEAALRLLSDPEFRNAAGLDKGGHDDTQST